MVLHMISKWLNISSLIWSTVLCNITKLCNHIHAYRDLIIAGTWKTCFMKTNSKKTNTFPHLKDIHMPVFFISLFQCIQYTTKIKQDKNENFKTSANMECCFSGQNLQNVEGCSLYDLKCIKVKNFVCSRYQCKCVITSSIIIWSVVDHLSCQLRHPLWN